MAGSAAIGFGEVWHRRNTPTVHEFGYGVNQIWIDPDRPNDLFARHPLWSASQPRPIRFRRRDYFDDTDNPIGPAIRAKLEGPLGRLPDGPIRMLTQPRSWGWLFNPITVYLVWDGDGPGPVGAVLEVTNTPWKERVHYPVALDRDGPRFTARFDKKMHVSPFLDQDFEYELTVSETPLPDDANDGRGSGARNLEVAIDVHRPDSDSAFQPGGTTELKSSTAVVETRLRLRLEQPNPTTLRTALHRNALSTHRVSLGIHWQAARLLLKRIPFVPHPRKRL